MSSAQNPEVSEFDVLRARAETNAAERDAVLDALEQLVACVNDKAWTPPEIQSVVWRAKSVLAEHGRRTR